MWIAYRVLLSLHVVSAIVAVATFWRPPSSRRDRRSRPRAVEMDRWIGGGVLVRLGDEQKTELAVARDRVRTLKERLGFR